MAPHIEPSADREFATVTIPVTFPVDIREVRVKLSPLELEQASALIDLQKTLGRDFAPSFAVDPSMVEIESPLQRSVDELTIAANTDGTLHLDLAIASFAQTEKSAHILCDIQISKLQRALTWAPDMYRAEADVIQSGSGMTLVQYANKTGADIDALQAVILERGDVESLFHFARSVPDADKMALQEKATLRHFSKPDHLGNSAYWLASFANISGADLAPLQAAVLASNDPSAIRQLAVINAQHGRDFSAEQAALIKGGSALELVEFALRLRDIESDLGADIAGIQSAIIASRDRNAIYRFARDIPDADIPALQQALIASAGPECRDAEDLVLFATNVREADIGALWAAITKTNDEHAVAKFYNRFEREVTQFNRQPKPIGAPPANRA